MEIFPRLKRFFVWYGKEWKYWWGGRAAEVVLGSLMNKHADKEQKDRYLKFMAADMPLSLFSVLLLWLLWLLIGLF